jgi:hypothetical protein
LPLEGELGRPRRKKPRLTVRTKYIGHRTASLLAEFDIWDVQVKYVMGEILKTSRAWFHCATRSKALMVSHYQSAIEKFNATTRRKLEASARRH